MAFRSTHRAESDSVTAELQSKLKVSEDTWLPSMRVGLLVCMCAIIIKQICGLNIVQSIDEIAPQD